MCLACCHFQSVPDQDLASEEVAADQAGQSAWVGYSGRMRLAAAQGNLDRAEGGRTEACRIQAAAEQSHPYRRIQAQSQGSQGSHEVHQVLGSGLAD